MWIEITILPILFPPYSIIAVQKVRAGSFSLLLTVWMFLAFGGIIVYLIIWHLYLTGDINRLPAHK
ncbi:hypothetical protein GFC29_3023 [Anoxybacillus sp. B7M1]|nr:hypothetical protein GFC28_2412 [Anoxybacillus sp. B2M1]ANB63955.1 hypothetical protein GFC29_3023 [Anoxybacillus sp. B7M1]MBB3908880.1 hypothetical protein [Anoxybacillus rupiensis]